MLDKLSLELEMAALLDRVAQYGYDPYGSTSHIPKGPRRQNPSWSEKDIQRVEQEMALISQVKTLYDQGQDEKQIAYLLGEPINRVIQIINTYLSDLEAQPSTDDLSEKAALMFRNKRSVAQIAKALGVTQKEVKSWLSKKGLLGVAKGSHKKGKAPKKRSKHNTDTKARALKLCDDTELSYAEIAKIVGVPRTTVNRWCKQAFGETRTTRVTQEQVDQIQDLCAQGLPLIAVANQVGLSIESVRKYCDRKPRKPATTAQKQQAKELYKQGASPKEIAATVGVSDTTVRRWVRGWLNVR